MTSSSEMTPSQEAIELARKRKRIAQQTYRARQKKYVLSLEGKIERLHKETYDQVNHLLSGNFSLSETLKELRKENSKLRMAIEQKLREKQSPRREILNPNYSVPSPISHLPSAHPSPIPHSRLPSSSSVSLYPSPQPPMNYLSENPQPSSRPLKLDSPNASASNSSQIRLPPLGLALPNATSSRRAASSPPLPSISLTSPPSSSVTNPSQGLRLPSLSELNLLK